jgi:hypothetical protein
MYIEEIDNILDIAIDDIFNELENYEKFLKELYKTKNFMKYEKKINELIITLLKIIDEDALKGIIKKTENINLVMNVIKKYCAYYFYIHIGLNYNESIQTFNNNITELSSSLNKIKIDDFYITYTNSKIIHSIVLIRELLEYFKNKTTHLLKPELELFLKTYGVHNLSKLEKFIKDEKNKNVKMHNLIKLIIFTNLYVSKEKEDIFNILEESENATGEYIFIDVVVPKNTFIDYHAIESILTENEIKNGLHKAIYNLINVDEYSEMENIKNYYSNYEYKINKLVEHNIITLIVDDILLYDNPNYLYEQYKETEKKKKDNTKIKFIVSNINKARDYYSDVKTNSKYFYEPYKHKNAVLINTSENYKIKSSVKNFINIQDDLIGLYVDFLNYTNYAYLSYKDIKNNNGFPISLSQTNDVIRFVSFDKNIEHPTTDLYVRSSSENDIINVVGFAVINKNIDLQCMNTTQFKNYSNLHNVNELIEEGLVNKIEFKYLNKKSDNFYVLFNLKTQKYNIGQNNTIDKYNNNVEMLVAYYYDYFIYQLILQLYNNFKKTNNKLIDYYIDNLNKFIYKYPDILNAAYINQYSSLLECIYQAVNIDLDKYDPSEDKFNGIFGKIFKIPTYTFSSSKKIQKLDITTLTKKKNIETIINTKLNNNAVCQHDITWRNIDKNNTNEIYEFIDNFVNYDLHNNYICLSCGAPIDIKNYVREPVYSDKKNQHLTDVLVNSNIEDIYEYSKYKTTITSLDKIIDKIGSISGLIFITGPHHSSNSNRKIITKNTIDLTIQQNLYATSISYYDNRQQILNKYGFIDKTTYSFPIFELENTIFIKSSIDDDLYKIMKYNTILSYVIILIILDLDELQILNLKMDKLINFTVFEKIFMQLFKNYKIIINIEHDVEHIYKYPVLCFIIFIIAGLIVKYNIYGKKDENILKKHIILIGLIIEYLNLILTAPSDKLVKNKIYVYEILNSKYYLKLSNLYNNLKFYEKVKSYYTSEKNVKDETTLFESSKYDMKYDECSIFDNKFIFKSPNTPYLLLTNPNLNTPNYMNEINNCSNCITGSFHNFNKNLSCDLCGININDCNNKKNNNIDIIENYKKEKLMYLTTKYCMNGSIHLFKNDICDLCHYDKNKVYNYSIEELHKLKKEIKHNKYLNYEVLKEKIIFQENKSEEEKKQILKIIDKLVDKHKKNNSDIKKTVLKFMDYVQSILGLDITINNEEYNLYNNNYKIYYDYEGKKLEKPINIVENSKNITFVKNHDIFGIDVIIFSVMLSVKIDLFYSVSTKILLGYKKIGKDLVKVKTNNLCVYSVNYSINNIFLLFGLKSVNLQKKDYYPNLINNADELEQLNMTDFINRISHLRFSNLLNLCLELKKYVSRLHNKYPKYLIPPPYSDKQIFSREDYEQNYYNNKNDINYAYTLKKFVSNTLNKDGSFFKNLATVHNYFNYETINHEINNKSSVSSSLIIEYDNSSNIILNYIIEEIHKFIENNPQNIKSILLTFIIELIINLFNTINIETSMDVSLIIFEQKLFQSDLFSEVYSSTVIDNVTDLYGLTTEDDLADYNDDLKEFVQNEKDDNEELNDALDEIEDDDYDETLNDVEFD